MPPVNPFATYSSDKKAADAVTSRSRDLPPTLRLRHRVPSKQAQQIEAHDTEDEQVCAPDPLERMSSRGILLLLASVATFVAFTLFVLAEMTHHDASFLLPDKLRREIHSTTQWVLLLLVPITSTAAWFPASISTQSTIQPPASPKSTSSSLLAVIACRYRRNGTFAVYQGIAWMLFACYASLMIHCSRSSTSSASSSSALPLCVPGNRSNIAVIAFISEELIISSVLALERRRDRNLRSSRDRFIVQVNNFNNMLVLLGAVALAAASEHARYSIAPRSSGGAQYALGTGVGSLLLFVTALLNTYGLGGLLSTKDGWSFFQPFRGGDRFVAFQIVSWSLFGGGLLLQLLYIVSLVMLKLEVFMGSMLAAGGLFLASEIATMMSLLVFRKDEDVGVYIGLEKKMRSISNECLSVLVVGTFANMYFIPNTLLLFYFKATTNLNSPDIVVYVLAATTVEFFMVISRSIATHMYNKDSNYGQQHEIGKYDVKYVLPRVITGALPAIAAYRHYMDGLNAFGAVLVLAIAMYAYEFTYYGEPGHSGRRMRPSWVTEKFPLMDRVKQYFSGRILTSAPPLDPNGQYIMAFHPHGIVPLTVTWLQFTDAWRQLFPKVYAHILTASVVHQLPLARDVLQFLGGREVSRQSFVQTLEEKESVMLVPGGQAEMLEQRSGVKQIRVITHHKGFIRLAIEHGVPLVPILSFREGELLSNVRASSLQQWFVKKLGFPFPYFPYGRWFLPVPRQEEVVVAVGAPLAVEKVENPSQEVVDKVHAEYFSRLEALFHEHKKSAGCEDFELVLI